MCSDVFEELSLEKCTWDRSNAAGEVSADQIHYITNKLLSGFSLDL